MQQQLSKLIIQAHRDDKFDGVQKIGEISPSARTVSGKTGFEVQINPEQWQRTHKIEYNKPENAGASGAQTQFKGIAPETLSIKFILDGTGAVRPTPASAGEQDGETFKAYPADYVSKRIKELKALIYDLDGTIHRTPFLTVLWGTEVFNGELQDLNIVYTLFSPSGSPLRAEVSLSLLEHVSAAENNAKAGLESPDLTHLRKSISGDTILTLCQSVYQNERYYLEIARVNKIIHFRNLPPNTELVFPPIEKSTRTIG